MVRPYIQQQYVCYSLLILVLPQVMAVFFPSCRRFQHISQPSQLAWKPGFVCLSTHLSNYPKNCIALWNPKMRKLFLMIRRFHDLGNLQCDVGAVCLIVSAWVRYAGTAPSLSPNGAYALLIFGQVTLGCHYSCCES